MARKAKLLAQMSQQQRQFAAENKGLLDDIKAEEEQLPGAEQTAAIQVAIYMYEICYKI